MYAEKEKDIKKDWIEVGERGKGTTAKRENQIE